MCTGNLALLSLATRWLRPGLAAALILIWAACPSAAQVETVPVFAAQRVLGAAAKGANYRVQDPVTTDGLLRIYTLETRYGTYTVYGDAMLLQRRRELAALATLEKQSQTKAFTNAMVRAGTAPIEFAGDLLTDPVQTTKRTISGIGEVFGRVTSGIANVGKSRDSAAKSALGISAAQRKVASDLGVDPYTDFPPLAQKLAEFARASALGGLVVKAGIAFIPGAAGTAVSTSSTVQGLGSLVQDKTPSQLTEVNRARLGKLGVPGATIEKFLSNSRYTPADQTVIAGALQQLRGVRDARVYVDRLVQADSRDLAVFLRARTEMIASYQQRTGAIARFVNIRGIPLTEQRDGSLMLLAPLDIVVWNSLVSKALTTVTSDIRKRRAGAKLILAISGTATPSSLRQLKQLGWSVTGAR